MRSAPWWTVIVVGVLAVVAMRLGAVGPAMAERPDQQSLEGGNLLMTTFPATNGGQHVVLIDTRERVIGTYQVDAVTGAVSLKSVRNIRWDLQMNEFNGGEPKPNEIRALLEQN